MAVATMLLALPAHAQSPDPGPVPDVHVVAFDGFSFAFSDELASSVNITSVLGDPAQTGPLAPTAPSTRFSLYGSTRRPVPGGQRGDVQLFRVADREGYRFMSGQLDELAALLADRPDLTQGAEGAPASIPLLEDEGAAQAIRFLPTYVDTDDLAGIMFVTAFAQDTYPFTRDSFTAVFQGISTDGTLAVTARFPLVIDVLPEEPSAELLDRVFAPGGWEPYLRRTLRRLAQAPADAFAPPIGSIGTLIGSMAFEDAVLPQAPPIPDAG